MSVGASCGRCLLVKLLKRMIFSGRMEEASRYCEYKSFVSSIERGENLEGIDEGDES